MYFRIYGGNKLWSKEEIETYFNIIDNHAVCIKNLRGDFNDGEYYSFKVGDVAQIFKTDDNMYLIRG